MFRKPFHVKNNVNLRNSDIRKLVARIPKDESNVVDKKAQVAHVKAVTQNRVLVNLYLFDKNPLFLDFDEKGLLYPTVYFLWKSPLTYPMLVVNAPVLQYLENGADLMLQGVAKNFPFPSFQKGDVLAIGLDIEGKIKPVAVGSALLSSDQMAASGFQGKGIQTIHVFKDSLWEFGTKGNAPVFEFSKVYPSLELTSNSDLVLKENNEDLEHSVEQLTSEVSAVAVSEGLKEEEEVPDEAIENLLFRCFITALKFRVTKKGALPMDVGQFYSQFLLKCVPPNRRLDMKKTKYKKFATFLDEMVKHQDGPILRITKKGKGVDLIAEIFWDHSTIRSFEATDEKIKDEEVPVGPTKGPTIAEYFAMTESVIKFFSTVTKASKGHLLTAAETRSLITQYVKAENLADNNGVKLDGLLGSFIKTNKNVVDWNTLVQSVQTKMTKTYVLTLPDGRELVRKINMPKLVFKVETRSSNKKVTLLDNLAVFGIEVKAICKEIQVSIATSATIQDSAANCEGPQLQVQGNQVAPISQILMVQYGIDKKYIKGLDLAPKKKK